MMKRILLMMYHMNCGGVEQAIIDLIKNIDPSMYRIDLMLLEKKGEFLKRIPENVNVIEVPMNDIEKTLILKRNIHDTIRYGLQHKMFFKTFAIGAKFFYYKMKHVAAPEYEAAFGSKRTVCYDIALDFHGYLSFTTYYVAKKVKCKQKYTWIHSEGFIKDINRFTAYLNTFNKIFCVSTKCAEMASEKLSNYKNIEVFSNFMDEHNIRQKANTGRRIKKRNDEFSILTVGRMSYPKGYDIAVETARILKDRNLDFKWYFCGDGELFEEVRKSVISNGLENVVELLGFQDNPYGYMDSCDVYVQTSRYEGNCLTIAEAAILNKVIITTDVSGARENVICGENGFITDGDAVSVADAIYHLYENYAQVRNMYVNRTSKNINSDSIRKLNQILTEC